MWLGNYCDLFTIIILLEINVEVCLNNFFYYV
jgi:hypothetical protein